MFKWVLKTYQMEVAKVIWSRERRRDCTRDKVSRQHDFKAWWRRTTATLLGVSFGNYRRRRRDVLMGHGRYVPLRRHWVFHLRLIWDVVETYWWDVVITSHETSSRHTKKTSWRCTTETCWRCSTETSLGVSFETYLRRPWDVQRDVVTTSPQHLVAGCVYSNKKFVWL